VTVGVAGTTKVLVPVVVGVWSSSPPALRIEEDYEEDYDEDYDENYDEAYDEE